jgi:4-amino-4-deoxy-L-arabinose transferase-like glycosyltransferase
LYSERRPLRPQVYLIAYAAISILLIAVHGPLLDLPYYWDEIGQFIPASLDLYQKGFWIPHSTLPNVHPPGVMALLAGFWHLFGYSIPGTRIAMLLIGGLGALFTFLLAIELGRGAPGAPAFTALAFLFVSPLFFAQAMLAQLDMPAMCFTALALLLFLQDRMRASAAVCVMLVLVKETGIAAPAVFGCWLLFERRTRNAVWFCLPGVALALWLVALKHVTGHWFGNAEFTQYNLFYPLNPIRLAFALLRRAYYLFVGSGHFIGTAALVWAYRRMPLLHTRAWRISGAFLAAHCIVVSVLGGAVLERYLLPVLPVLYAAFAISLWSLLPRWRTWALAALLLCLCCANFINPVYPFPFENNLAFVNFVSLERRAAVAVEDRPGVLATTFPMADAFRRTEFGYVRTPRKVRELADFRPESIAPLREHPPELMIVYDTTWDPLQILSRNPGGWLMARFYGYEPILPPQAIASMLSMRVARRWERGGLTMSLLVRDPSR